MPDTTPISTGSAPGKPQLRTIRDLDGRTRAARRARDLAAAFATDLGGMLSAAQEVAVNRAATMAAIAEDAQARRLAGDSSISYEDLTRLDRCADLAVRRLGIKPGAPAKPESLEDYLRRTAAPAANASPAGDEIGRMGGRLPNGEATA